MFYLFGPEGGTILFKDNNPSGATVLTISSQMNSHLDVFPKYKGLRGDQDNGFYLVSMALHLPSCL